MFSTLIVTVDITLTFIMMTATAAMKSDEEKIVFFSGWNICDIFHLSYIV